MLLIALFEFSLTSFADFEETSEMLPLEPFETLTVEKVENNASVNKKKGEKRAVKSSPANKASKKPRIEEEDDFSLTASASTAPMRIYANMSPVLPSTYQHLEKPSKKKKFMMKKRFNIKNWVALTMTSAHNHVLNQLIIQTWS